MPEFTPAHAARWNAWQQANAVSARRGDAVARLFGFTLLAGAVTAVAVALWR